MKANIVKRNWVVEWFDERMCFHLSLIHISLSRPDPGRLRSVRRHRPAVHFSLQPDASRAVPKGSLTRGKARTVYGPGLFVQTEEDVYKRQVDDVVQGDGWGL